VTIEESISKNVIEEQVNEPIKVTAEKRNNYEDIFGSKKDFNLSKNSKSQVERIGITAKTIDIFDSPAHILPPISSLYHPFIERLIIKNTHNKHQSNEQETTVEKMIIEQPVLDKKATDFVTELPNDIYDKLSQIFKDEILKDTISIAEKEVKSPKKGKKENNTGNGKR